MYCIERHFKRLFTVIIIAELTNSPWHLYRQSFVVSWDIDDLHLLRMRSNVNRNVFNDRKKCKRYNGATSRSHKGGSKPLEGKSARRKTKSFSRIKKSHGTYLSDQSALASKSIIFWYIFKATAASSLDTLTHAEKINRAVYRRISLE